MGRQKIFNSGGNKSKNVRLSLCVLDYFHFHSFMQSGHFYSASSSPLLLRSAPDTARILCMSFTPKRHKSVFNVRTNKDEIIGNFPRYIVTLEYTRNT